MELMVKLLQAARDYNNNASWQASKLADEKQYDAALDLLKGATAVGDFVNAFINDNKE